MSTPQPNDHNMTIAVANESLLHIFGDVCLYSYAEQKETPAREVLANKVVSGQRYKGFGGEHIMFVADPCFPCLFFCLLF